MFYEVEHRPQGFLSRRKKNSQICNFWKIFKIREKKQIEVEERHSVPTLDSEYNSTTFRMHNGAKYFN